MTKGKKIALGVTVGIPLLCCLGGVAIMEGLFGSSARTRDRELELARRQGLPTTAEALTAMAKAPESENAAPVYRLLMAMDRKGSQVYRDIEAVNQGASPRSKPEVRAAAIAACGRLGPAMDLVKRAAKFPHCDFDRDWSKGGRLEFPEYPTLKNMAKVLSMDAQRRSRAGDWSGALEDLAASEQMSHHIREEPILIALLVSVAIESIDYVALRNVIEAHSHDPAFLAAARKTLAAYGPLPDYRRAIMGELAMGRLLLRDIHTFHDLSAAGMDDGSATHDPNSFERGLFGSGIVKDAFDARLIRFYRRFIADLPADPAKWEQSEVAAKKADLSLMNDHSLVGIGFESVVPVFDPATVAIQMQLARRNLLDTTLRLLQDRARTGKLPRFLPDYGPSRLDPFSGRPLVYRREGAGFILYSFGRDGVDHGGKTNLGGGGGEGYDELIRIP